MPGDSGRKLLAGKSVPITRRILDVFVVLICNTDIETSDMEYRCIHFVESWIIRVCGARRPRPGHWFFHLNSY